MRPLIAMVATACLAACLCETSAARSASDDRPSALRRVDKSRAKWKTARVEWVLEQSPTTSTPRFYEAQIAGDDKLIVDYGDEEGVIQRYTDGEPQPYGFGPFYTLHLGGDVWHYGEGRIDANLATGVAPEASVDFRTLGLAPRRHCGDLNDALGKSISKIDDEVTYDARREDGLEIVTASAADYTVTWRIDPKAGGLPISVTTEHAGEVLSRSVSTPAKFGDTWYPSRVEDYRSSYADGLEPYEVIQVQTVEPNPRDIPEHLSPEYIHIDTGVAVNVRRGLGSKTAELRKWNGKATVSLEQFAREYHQGEIEMGPYFSANVQRAEAMLELDRTHKLLAAGKQSPVDPAVATGAKTETSTLEKLTGWGHTRRASSTSIASISPKRRKRYRFYASVRIWRASTLRATRRRLPQSIRRLTRRTATLNHVARPS